MVRHNFQFQYLRLEIRSYAPYEFFEAFGYQAL
jgi:hypothetical protein